jgi:hypothetical protein
MELKRVAKFIRDDGLNIGETYQFPLVSDAAYKEWCIAATDNLLNLAVTEFGLVSTLDIFGETWWATLVNTKEKSTIVFKNRD